MTATATALSSARWRRLIPIAFITYSFAYVDRSNYSIAAAGGLTEQLGGDVGACPAAGHAHLPSPVTQVPHPGPNTARGRRT